jgi:hypothetical protein
MERRRSAFGCIYYDRVRNEEGLTLLFLVSNHFACIITTFFLCPSRYIGLYSNLATIAKSGSKSNQKSCSKEGEMCGEVRQSLEK